MRLTELSIKNLPTPHHGQKTYFDDTVRGFGVRVSQGGTKSYVVMFGPRRRLKTLGRFDDISLKDARSEAKVVIATADPNPLRSTFSEALTAFLEHCERHTAERTKKDYERLLRRHFPEGKLADLTRHQLLNKLSNLSARPGEQSHAATAFNVFLNWCAAHGYMQGNPIAGVRGIGRIKSRDRTLNAEEIKAVYNRALKYGHPFGNIVLLCITTGQRRSEIVNLRRSWIGEGTITFPAAVTKNRREHTVPFGDLTQSILDRIPDSGELLFKGRGKNVWNGWSKAKKEFDEKTPLPHWTLHDLRRTFSTLHAEIGTPIHITERLLNHVSGATTGGIIGIYNRYSYLEEMRAAASTYEKHLATLIDT